MKMYHPLFIPPIKEGKIEVPNSEEMIISHWGRNTPIPLSEKFSLLLVGRRLG
jgi:hypothetical protein